ncbi:MAG: hypothetical protein ABEI98_01995 [Halorhabdus sp.]
MSDGFLLVSYVFDRGRADDRMEVLRDAIEEDEGLDLWGVNIEKIQTDTDSYVVEVDRNVPPRDRSAITVALKPDRMVGDSGKRYVEDALDVLTSVYQITEPLYVYGMHVGQMEMVGRDVDPPVTESSLAGDRINYPSWLMAFSPAMVQEYGQEFLTRLPADHVEELGDGGVLVVGRDDFTSCEFPRDVEQATLESRETLAEAFGDRLA